MENPTPEEIAQLIIVMLPAVSGDRAAAMAEANQPGVLGDYQLSWEGAYNMAQELHSLDPTLDMAEWVALIQQQFANRLPGGLPAGSEARTFPAWGTALMIAGVLLFLFSMKPR